MGGPVPFPRGCSQKNPPSLGVSGAEWELEQGMHLSHYGSKRRVGNSSLGLLVLQWLPFPRKAWECGTAAPCCWNFLAQTAAKFQLLPCPGYSLEKGKGSGACSAALGQPFPSLCNKWINLLFIEKKKTFFPPFFSLFFFFLLICTLWAFCGPCWHSQVGFVWRQAACWNSRREVLCQIHGLCSIPRVVLYGSNLCAGIPGWFCKDPTSLLEFQGGSVQIHGLCWNSRVVLCGSNLSAGIPRWFCARSMSVLEFQGGSVQIHGLCSIPRVDLYGSNLSAGIPRWFCADPAAPAGSAKHYTTFPKENPCFPGHSQAPTNSINPGPGALKPDLNPGGSSSVLARIGGCLCK
ncbi:uncharacterized protein LOC113973226 isoform X2 [Neopelma chrysocephalum]|uniref:uncharacterized protein LOC113973226 isoform X2 n=1 Tax=Neopelma chrysocephalum TaxID=114329 RepID=UPI000FCD2AA1|nr:uncharacterized protein LOC113973226 isoform X2 [Neopelma chrysocephalum]